MSVAGCFVEERKSGKGCDWENGRRAFRLRKAGALRHQGSDGALRRRSPSAETYSDAFVSAPATTASVVPVSSGTSRYPTADFLVTLVITSSRFFPSLLL